MSEKRFTLLKELCREDMTKSYVTIYDIDSKQQYVNLTEIVNLCNSLNDENEQLKGILKNIVHQIDVTYKKPAPMSFAKVNLLLSEYDKLKEVCFK